MTANHCLIQETDIDRGTDLHTTPAKKPETSESRVSISVGKVFTAHMMERQLLDVTGPWSVLPLSTKNSTVADISVCVLSYKLATNTNHT